ncbi:hypothetical protein MASR2M78_24460 [Treponema sp.]
MQTFLGIGNVHEGLAGLSHSFAEAEADMLEMMAEKDNSRQKKIADTIRDYIKEHHQDDIYQESIADALGVSASYASKAFRQKAGVSIKDYLDAFRMEKARELIAETEERIEDISEQVGIRNRSTFLRLFRKYASMSPSEYREKSAQSRRG